MFTFLLLIGTALAAGLGSVLLPTGIPFIGDKSLLCNPRRQAIQYTGYRVFEVAAVRFPVRHYWYVTRCNNGKVTDHQYFPSKRNDNFIFAQEFCLGEDKCFSISRRKKYSNRDVPIYRPFSQIGALYKSVNNVTTEPLLPVHGDNTANMFTIGTMRYMPLLYTTEGLVNRDWERRVGVKGNEKYCYTKADKKKLWYKMNQYLTKSINKISLKKQLAFWEFDPVKLQLMGIDWRRPINQWIVCKNWKKKSGKKQKKPCLQKNCSSTASNCTAQPEYMYLTSTKTALTSATESFDEYTDDGMCPNPDCFPEYAGVDDDDEYYIGEEELDELGEEENEKNEEEEEENDAEEEESEAEDEEDNEEKEKDENPGCDCCTNAQTG